MKESKPRSPWSSGSFYLFAGVVTGALVLFIATHVPWYAVPIIVVATLLFSSVIGALQLRHDKRLTEKTFLRLVVILMRPHPCQSAHGEQDSSSRNDRHAP